MRPTIFAKHLNETIIKPSGGPEKKHYKHPFPAHKKYLHKSIFQKKIIYKIYKSGEFFKNCLWSFSFQGRYWLIHIKIV